MSIPTFDEINVHNTLDERSACEHFLGKNLEEAELLFHQNSAYYQEDLMWMGPKAFCYYVESVIRYLQSDVAANDSAIISCFAGILEFRLSSDKAELLPVAKRLASACEYVINHWNKFSISAEIYGNLPSRYITLRQTLTEIANG
jgi:hypothetical protein